MNSPLTKRRRAKNSPFHREVTPEDREGMGLGKHHGGSDSGASSGPQPCCRLRGWAPSPPTIQRATPSCTSPLCSQAVLTGKVLGGWSTPACTSVTANTH